MTKVLLSVSAKELMVTQTVLEKTYADKDTKATRAELHRCLGGVCYLRLPRVEQALKSFQLAVKSDPQDPPQLQKTFGELNKVIKDFLIFHKKGGPAAGS